MQGMSIGGASVSRFGTHQYLNLGFAASLKEIHELSLPLRRQYILLTVEHRPSLHSLESTVRKLNILGTHLFLVLWSYWDQLITIDAQSIVQDFCLSVDPFIC